MKNPEINRQIQKLRELLRRGLEISNGTDPYPRKVGRMDACIGVALIHLDSLEREIHHETPRAAA